MKPEAPVNGIVKNKSKTYFIIAAIFFMLLALTWSIDTSLIYIFLGAGSFFLFLSFFNRRDPREENSFNKRSYREGRGKPEVASAIENILKTFFQRKTVRHATASPVVQDRGRRIVLIVMFVIFMMSLAPVMVALFSSGDASYDALSYYGMAEQQYLAQEYDSAYINYKRAIQLDPEYTEAIVGYGNVLIIRNERDSAILMFDKALELDPDYKEAVYNKALVLYDQKKYTDGIALLTSLLEGNPDYSDAILLLGDYYYIQGKYDEALPWYENAYRNGGIRSRILCHIMAYIYDNKGDYEKAVPLYQEALSYDSSVVDIYQRLGELIPGDNGSFYRSKAKEMSQ